MTEQNETPRTREAMIAQCKASDPDGKNQAIQRHIKKLEMMSEYDYELHRQKLVALRAKARPTVERLARDLFSQFDKS